MARIRTIKPEFPQSETVGRLSRDARLLYIQLWTIADDSGRARAASRLLASLLYPYDDDAADLIDGWLDELEALHCIQRYRIDGTLYLQVCSWSEHQKIDRPTPTKLPEPPPLTANSPNPREHIASPREPSIVDHGPRTMDQGTVEVDQHPPYPPQAGGSDDETTKPPRDDQLMFGVLVDWLGYKLDGLTPRTRGRVNKLGAELRTGGFLLADVERARTWWAVNDWRGKKGQAPTIRQAAECVEQHGHMPTGPQYEIDDYGFVHEVGVRATNQIDWEAYYRNNPQTVDANGRD